MKKYFVSALAFLVMFSGLQAQPMKDLVPATSAAEILALVPGIENKTFAELTLAERAQLSDALSIKRQEGMYVMRAGMASFAIPGLGQFMTGKPLEGSLFMVTEAGIMGATMAGAWYLMPADLRLSIGSRSTMRTYMLSGNMTKALPVMGVMAGGMTLSLVDALISSNMAAAGAREDLKSGAVKFEPRLMSSHSGMGMGFGIGF
ncbi:MAG: hypothetical protein WCQ50_00485 [Spirochaetota bacterium]